MNIFKKLFKKKTHDKNGFPLNVIGHSYCIKWYLWICRQDEVRAVVGDRLSDKKFLPVNPATDTVAFAHHNVGIYGDDKSGLVDGLIPAIKIGNRVGLYRLVKRYKRDSLTSDPASYDDCMQVDLKFVKSISA